MSGVRRHVAMIVGLALLTAASLARADPPTFDLHMQGREVDLVARLAGRDLGDALGLAPHAVPSRAQAVARAAIAGRYVVDQLYVANEGVPCSGAVTSAAVRDAPDGFALEVHARYTCVREIDDLILDDRLLFALDPHREDAAVVDAFGVHRELVFRTEARRARFTGPPSRTAQFVDDVRAGAVGWGRDAAHLAFLLAVVLHAATLGLRRGARQALAVLAGVAVTQTAALACVAWGVVDVPAPGVAGAVAASVVYLAVENAVDPAPRWRWAVASLFGVAHGLGYAAVWTALHVPTRARLATVAGFEVGVVGAQLLAGAAVLAAWVAFRRAASERVERGASLAISVALAMIGLFWIVRDVFAR